MTLRRDAAHRANRRDEAYVGVSVVEPEDDGAPHVRIQFRRMFQNTCRPLTIMPVRFARNAVGGEYWPRNNCGA